MVGASIYRCCRLGPQRTERDDNPERSQSVKGCRTIQPDMKIEELPARTGQDGARVARQTARDFRIIHKPISNPSYRFWNWLCQQFELTTATSTTRLEVAIRTRQ